MPTMILYGDTEHSASMRHEVPMSIGDPFVVAIDGAQSWIMCSALEANRLAACRPDARLLDIQDLGFYELLESGLSRDELELASRAMARTGIREATVEFEFPFGLASRLRDAD